MAHMLWNILVCSSGHGHAVTPTQVHRTFKYYRPGRGDCSIDKESYGRSTRAERRRLPRVPEEMLRMRVKSTLQARQEMVQEGTTRDRQTGSGAPGVLCGNFWILPKAYLQRGWLVDRARQDQGWNGATARRDYIGRLKVLLRRLPRVPLELGGGRWGLVKLDFGE